jgi:hypothetical protein
LRKFPASEESAPHERNGHYATMPGCWGRARDRDERAFTRLWALPAFTEAGTARPHPRRTRRVLGAPGRCCHTRSRSCSRRRTRSGNADPGHHGAYRPAEPRLTAHQRRVAQRKVGQSQIEPPPRVSVQGHQHLAFQSPLIAHMHTRAGEPPPARTVPLAPKRREPPAPGPSAQTVTASTPPAAHTSARPGSTYLSSTRSHRSARRTRSAAIATVICVTLPPKGTPVARLSWQKSADGSDTLALAQIRWQRTVPAAGSPP